MDKLRSQDLLTNCSVPTNPAFIICVTVAKSYGISRNPCNKDGVSDIICSVSKVSDNITRFFRHRVSPHFRKDFVNIEQEGTV